MTLLLAHSYRLSHPRHFSSPLQHRSLVSSQPAVVNLVRHPRGIRCCAVPLENGGFEESGFGPASNSPSPGMTNSVASSKNNIATANSASGVAEVAAAVAAWIPRTESRIERAIFDFRFLTLMAIAGSLVGSLLCFLKVKPSTELFSLFAVLAICICCNGNSRQRTNRNSMFSKLQSLIGLKGTGFICESFIAYFKMCLNGRHTGKVILRLVEAIDVYLVGTVMLIFGMGLYGLFISSQPTEGQPDRALKNTTLFGMFALKARPLWMKITTLDTLKTKLGHVIVTIFLVKLFEKSKTVHISSAVDLLYYSISIFLSSAALYVLQRLHGST